MSSVAGDSRIGGESTSKPDGIQQLQQAFETLADRYADRPIYGGFGERKRPEYNWRTVGLAFCEILNNPVHKEHHLAAEAVQQLLQQQECTALDLASFLFECSRGVGSSTSERLASAGFKPARIKKIHGSCERLATEIEKFNSSVPGPITYLEVVWQRTASSRDAHRRFVALPETLRLYAETIRVWPPPPPRELKFTRDHRRFGHNWYLCYFYLYLKRLKGTFSMLSVLLAAMRDAWFQVFPDALKSLNKKGVEKASDDFPFLIFAQRTRGKLQKSDIDPLSAQALQAAISEFRRNNARVHQFMERHISRYFEEQNIRDYVPRGRRSSRCFICFPDTSQA